MITRGYCILGIPKAMENDPDVVEKIIELRHITDMFLAICENKRKHVSPSRFEKLKTHEHPLKIYNLLEIAIGILEIIAVYIQIYIYTYVHI